MPRALLLIAGAILLLPMTANAQQPVMSPAATAGRSAVYAPEAVISTSQPLATSAGL